MLVIENLSQRKYTFIFKNSSVRPCKQKSKYALIFAGTHFVIARFIYVCLTKAHHYFSVCTKTCYEAKSDQPYRRPKRRQDKHNTLLANVPSSTPTR